MVFKSPRFEPGTAIGTGTRVIGLWLGDASRGEGAPIPTQVAKHLRGEKFRNFDAFRRKFWKTVANDPDLSTQFEERSLLRMRKHGYAPGVDDLDIYMSQMTYVLHHSTPISESGGVYDMDNIRIVTPLAHNKIHYGDKQ